MPPAECSSPANLTSKPTNHSEADETKAASDEHDCLSLAAFAFLQRFLAGKLSDNADWLAGFAGMTQAPHTHFRNLRSILFKFLSKWRELDLDFALQVGGHNGLRLGWPVSGQP